MRLLLLLMVVGVVVWQYPQALNVVADIAGIADGDACESVEEYMTAIGDNSISAAEVYKFPGDRFPQWADHVDDIESVECTCVSDLSDQHIQQIDAIPDSVTNVTDAQLALFTFNGTYEGDHVTVKGSTFAFRPISKNWFLSQEQLYEVDGEPRDQLNIADFAAECSPS